MGERTTMEPSPSLC